MKKIISLLFLLVVSHAVFCQTENQYTGVEGSEFVRQIQTSGLADILSFQSPNREINSSVLAQQVGDQNKVTINQQTDAGSNAGNQAYSVQQGNSNEMTLGQAGSGNTLLSFQLGYATTEFGRLQSNDYGIAFENLNAFTGGYSGSVNQTVTGERNKMAVNQDGRSNSMITVQFGSDNSISAGQSGTNNYLVLYQQGKNNSISGYIQENNSEQVLFDSVIQQGEGLTLNATGASESKPNGNNFTQSGTNLTLQVNNAFVNTLGGMQINQTGRDMTVVIDQSYFSFPTH